MNEVMVVGGGVVGLSAALAMRQRGFSVTLLDAGSLTSDASSPISPRVYAINPASQRLLQALHVWDALDKTRLSPYEHMQVWDSTMGAQIDLDARMIAAPCLGFIIDEGNLKHALLQEIAKHDIQLCPGSSVTAVQVLAEGVTLEAGGRAWSAQLLIIADGALSPTRHLLGVQMTQWAYHQHALVATIQIEKPHQKTAFQVFHEDGILACLPLQNPYQCSMVWSAPSPLTEQRMALSDKAFNHQLQTTFEHQLGQMTVCSQRHAFPLHMRHVQQYVGTRWLLMGDAAHTIHPLAGLGLNLGLADLAAWLDLLRDERHHPDAKKTLGAYQRQRKHAVWQTIVVMEGLKRTFLSPFPPVAVMRNLGLSLCNQLTPLKRWLIDYAS